MANSRPSALIQSLSSGWLRCTFCFKEFTPTIQFYLLSCTTVGCKGCIIKMRSRVTANKVDCTLCSKTVDCVPIRDQMPATIRSKFVEKTSEAGLFQLRIQDNITKSMNKEDDRLTKELAKQNYEAVQNEAKTAPIDGESTRYAAQVLKVMTKDHLDHLLTLSEEELNQMSYDSMMAGQKRGRRKSRVYSTVTRSSDRSSSNRRRPFMPAEPGLDCGSRNSTSTGDRSNSVSNELGGRLHTLQLNPQAAKHHRRNSNRKLNPPHRGSGEYQRRDSLDHQFN